MFTESPIRLSLDRWFLSPQVESYPMIAAVKTNIFSDPKTEYQQLRVLNNPVSVDTFDFLQLVFKRIEHDPV